MLSQSQCAGLRSVRSLCYSVNPYRRRFRVPSSLSSLPVHSSAQASLFSFSSPAGTIASTLHRHTMPVLASQTCMFRSHVAAAAAAAGIRTIQTFPVGVPFGSEGATPRLLASTMLKIQASAERGDIAAMIAILQSEIQPVAATRGNAYWVEALRYCLSALEGMNLQSSMIAFIRHLNQENLLRTCEDWNEAVKYASRFTERPAEVVEVIRCMLDNNFVPMDDHVIFITRAMTANKLTDQMLSLINMLFDHKIVPPADACMNAINLLTASKNLPVALEILTAIDSISGRHVKANIYMRVLDAATDANNTEVAIVVREMLHRRNIKNHPALMQLYAQVGRLDDAIAVFKNSLTYGFNLLETKPLILLSRYLINANREHDIAPLLVHYLNANIASDLNFRAWGHAVGVLAYFRCKSDIADASTAAEALFHRSYELGMEPVEIMFRHFFIPELFDLRDGPIVGANLDSLYTLFPEKVTFLEKFYAYVQAHKRCPSLFRLTGTVTILSENEMAPGPPPTSPTRPGHSSSSSQQLHSWPRDQLILDIFDASMDGIIATLHSKHPSYFVQSSLVADLGTAGSNAASGQQLLCNLHAIPVGYLRWQLVKVCLEVLKSNDRLVSNTEDISAQGGRGGPGGTASAKALICKYFTLQSYETVALLHKLNWNTRQVTEVQKKERTISNCGESMVAQLRKYGKSSHEIIHQMMATASPSTSNLPWIEHFTEAATIYRLTLQPNLQLELVGLMKKAGVEPSAQCLFSILDAFKKSKNVKQMLDYAISVAVQQFEDSASDNGVSLPRKLRDRRSQAELQSQIAWFPLDSCGDHFAISPSNSAAGEAPQLVDLRDGNLLFDTISFILKEFHARNIQDDYSFDERLVVFEKVYVLLGCACLHNVMIDYRSVDQFVKLAVALVSYANKVNKDDKIKLRIISQTMDYLDATMALDRHMPYFEVSQLFETAIACGASDGFVVDLFEINPQRFIFSCLSSYQLEAILKAMRAERKHVLAMQTFEFAIRRQDELGSAICKDVASWEVYLEAWGALTNSATLGKSSTLDKNHGHEEPVFTVDEMKQCMAMAVKSASRHNQLINIPILAKIIAANTQYDMTREAYALVLLAANDMQLTQHYTRNHPPSVAMINNAKLEQERREAAWKDLKAALDMVSEKLLTLACSEDKAISEDAIAMLGSFNESKNAMHDFALQRA